MNTGLGSLKYAHNNIRIFENFERNREGFGQYQKTKFSEGGEDMDETDQS
jgi:hypothetical protein